MASLITYPSGLCLAGNISPLLMTAYAKTRVTLKKGGTTILDESYLPYRSQIEVDIKDVVLQQLSFHLPSSSLAQSSIFADFSLELDGVEATTFRAIRAGVAADVDAGTWLKANFLTWQPQSKVVTFNQPEWLTYYFVEAGSFLLKFYYTDGSYKEVVYGDSVAAGDCLSKNMQMAAIWGLGEEEGKTRSGLIDAWVENTTGVRLSYVQRYIYRVDQALDKVFLCENTLGGIDTFLLTGENSRNTELEYTLGQYADSFSSSAEGVRAFSQNSGALSDQQIRWSWELLRSAQSYVVDGAELRKIVIEESSIEDTSLDNIKSFNFSYRYAEDDGYLNISRTTTLPTNIEITGPDSELFFLAPRLVEFPSANLGDGVLLPVQSPFSEQWQKTSIAELKKYFIGEMGEQPVYMEIVTDGDYFLAPGETLTAIAVVMKGWTNITNMVESWKIERDSGSTQDDLAWGIEHKDFRGTVEIAYEDLGSNALITKKTTFTITASNADMNIKKTIEI